jgi:hypothetical protein
VPGGPPRNIPSTPAGGFPSIPEPRQQDPEALKGALDGFQAAFEKAAKDAAEPPAVERPPAVEPAPDSRRGGLTRRVPGTNMAPGLRKQPVAGRLPARVANTWQHRDPDADRAKFDSFTAGLAHAATPSADILWPSEQLETEMDTKNKGTNR